MIQTKCHHCIFKIEENGKQVGCKLGRLEKFQSINVATADDSGSYTISRLCSACRHKDISKYENPEEEVLKEIACKFTVIVDHLEGKEFDLESIKREKPHQVIIVCSLPSVLDLFKKVSAELSGTGILFDFINFKDVPTMNSILKRVKGDHIIESNHLPEGILEKFNSLIVNDLKTYLVYSGEIDIVSTTCYKMMSPNKQEVIEYIRNSPEAERFLCGV